MGFWFFMLAMSLLVPFMMILFGGIFYKKAPNDINYLFGYRTTASMRNEDTWKFAHRFLGKLWLVIGTVLAVVSVVLLLFVIGKNTDTVGTVGYVVCIANVVMLILSILPTEIALKKTFDEKGNRKI